MSLLSSIDRPRWSKHAHERCAQLRIPASLAERTVARPGFTYPDPRGLGRIRCHGEGIVVVFAPDTRRVITVLLDTRVPFTHGVHHLDNLPTN